MFNFTTLILYSILSLGFGYAVGNAHKFGILKFLFLIIFITPVVYITENKFYVVSITASFLFGLLYAHTYLFDGFFDSILYQKDKWERQKTDRKTKAEDYKRERKQYEQEKQQTQQRHNEKEAELNRREQKKQQAEQNYQQREDDLNRREQEQQRRTEEARRTREEQKRKKEENQEKNQSKKSSSGSDTKRTPEEILGLKPGFTAQELKKAYQRESNRCHPDKWAGKPHRIQELMAEEQKLVNWAYNKLK